MTPNWTMPKSSTSRIGRMNANSVIVWPRSFLMCRLKFISAPTSEKVAEPSPLGRGLRHMPGRLGEQPHHAYECVRSAVREACEGQDRSPADHGESERGVRLRLSTLTP